MSNGVKDYEEYKLAENMFFSEAEMLAELAYRIPSLVRTIRLFASGDIYAVCPKCGISLTREYMAFCDVCGQKLNWSGFDNAEIIKVPFYSDVKKGLL